MAASLDVPTVTEQDLIDFHRAHIKFSSEVELGNPTEPGLGYYPDGTPRTLTDDDIAYFRQREIRTLLLQRMKKAADALSEGEVDSAQDEPTSEESNRLSIGTNVPSDAAEYGQGPNASHAPPMGFNQDDEDDESEYASFLEQERKEFMQATQRQRQKWGRGRDDSDRAISTRRRIREMDACDDAGQMLSYDDDAQPQPATGTKAAAEDSEENAPANRGKKFWWPQLGVQSEDSVRLNAY